jgi:ABC-2 type transport system ATP-binding protein
VGSLSGGQKPRLALAVGRVVDPELLFLDEPTSGLDLIAFRATWEAEHALRRDEGLTVLLTTHRPDEAEACDRLAVLSGGRVVVTGAPDDLRARVRGDVIVVEAAEPAPLAAEIAERFGVPAVVSGGAIHVEHERGHELVPRLVEAFPAGRFRSIALRRPTLSDAFLAITGLDLEEDASPEPSPLAPRRARRSYP